jgi:hypothetical protein
MEIQTFIIYLRIKIHHPHNDIKAF